MYSDKIQLLLRVGDNKSSTCVYDACMCAYMHSGVWAYTHTCIRAYINTCICVYMHTCIFAYMNTCIHAGKTPLKVATVGSPSFDALRDLYQKMNSERRRLQQRHSRPLQQVGRNDDGTRRFASMGAVGPFRFEPGAISGWRSSFLLSQRFVYHDRHVYITGIKKKLQRKAP